MDVSDKVIKVLENFQTPPNIKLALLWASLMFLYIYNDYFSLYVPGQIARIAEGRLGPLGPATQGALIGVSLLLALPSLMVFLSVALPALASRWLNILFGLLYTAVEVLTSGGSFWFYRITVGLEIILSVLIVWTALRWPKKVVAG